MGTDALGDIKTIGHRPVDTGLMDEIRVNTVCATNDLYTKDHVIRETGDRWKNGAVCRRGGVGFIS